MFEGDQIHSERPSAGRGRVAGLLRRVPSDAMYQWYDPWGPAERAAWN